MVLFQNDDKVRFAKSETSNGISTQIPKYNISTFPTNETLLEITHFRKHVQLNKANVNQFVFVTAASDNYLPVVEKSIATVQEYFSGRKIIFFDLNQEESEVWQESVVNKTSMGFFKCI